MNLNKKSYKILLAIVVSVCLLAGGFLLLNNDGKDEPVLEETKSEETSTEIKSESIEVVDDYSIELLAEAKEANSDTVAWLKVPGTEVDNQIMQTSNNSDYLYLNEQKEHDTWGCYFADYYSNLSSKDGLIQNTVIYGHAENSKHPENPDGNRFSQLFKFLDIDFVKENPSVYLTVNEDIMTFEIFAVFYTGVDFYYINPTPSNMGFEEFMNTVNAKNEYIFEGISVSESDKILTLSTCSHKYDVDNTGDHRLVVMGKLVEEEAEVDVTMNPDPVRP